MVLLIDLDIPKKYLLFNKTHGIKISTYFINLYRSILLSLISLGSFSPSTFSYWAPFCYSLYPFVVASSSYITVLPSTFPFCKHWYFFLQWCSWRNFFVLTAICFVYQTIFCICICPLFWLLPCRQSVDRLSLFLWWISIQFFFKFISRPSLKYFCSFIIMLLRSLKSCVFLTWQSLISHRYLHAFKFCLRFVKRIFQIYF